MVQYNIFASQKITETFESFVEYLKPSTQAVTHFVQIREIVSLLNQRCPLKNECPRKVCPKTALVIQFREFIAIKKNPRIFFEGFRRLFLPLLRRCETTNLEMDPTKILYK